MAFKMKGNPYKRGDMDTSAFKNYRNPGEYKVFNMGNKPTSFKKNGSDKKVPKNPEHDDNAVTSANIARFSKSSGYSVADINSLIKELSATGGGGTEDDFTMSDVKSAMADRYEGNVDELD